MDPQLVPRQPIFIVNHSTAVCKTGRTQWIQPVTIRNGHQTVITRRMLGAPRPCDFRAGGWGDKGLLGLEADSAKFEKSFES